MNSFQFKKNEFKKLCVTIGFKPLAVQQIIDQLDTYYDEWTEQKVDKATGTFKRYKDGTIKQRVIRPSLKELKSIQKRIKENILVPIPLPTAVHGGVKKRSNVTNAKPHQGNKYVFTTDLQDFYPSISFQKVYDTFVSLRFSPHYSHWLTKLTTWKYELPQGTPTSTHIANLVFLETDKKLIAFSNTHGLTYTRFVDDLTFSSQQDFRHLTNDILEIIQSSNFKISYRKTSYSGNQTVTGIEIFPNKIDAPKSIIEKSQAEIEGNALDKPFTNYRHTITRTNKKSMK